MQIGVACGLGTRTGGHPGRLLQHCFIVEARYLLLAPWMETLQFRCPYMPT